MFSLHSWVQGLKNQSAEYKLIVEDLVWTQTGIVSASLSPSPGRALPPGLRSGSRLWQQKLNSFSFFSLKCYWQRFQSPSFLELAPKIMQPSCSAEQNQAILITLDSNWFLYILFMFYLYCWDIPGLFFFLHKDQTRTAVLNWMVFRPIGCVFVGWNPFSGADTASTLWLQENVNTPRIFRPEPVRLVELCTNLCGS